MHTRYSTVHTHIWNICICLSILSFISINILLKITDALVWTSLHVPTGYNDTSLTREAISFLTTVEKSEILKFPQQFHWGFASYGEWQCLPDVLKENTALRTSVTTSPTAHHLILHHLNPYRNFSSLVLFQSAGTPVQNYTTSHIPRM